MGARGEMNQGRGDSWSGWRRTLVAPVAAFAVAATGACSGDTASADQENNEPTIATAPTTTEPITPQETTAPEVAETDTQSSGVIDVYTGEEIPAEVFELMQMDSNDFLALPLEMQRIFHKYKLEHPGYVGGDFETVIIQGWEPSYGVDETASPLNNPASWDDSDDEIVQQLNFLSGAALAQVKLNENSGIGYVDRKSVIMMLGAMYGESIGEMLKRQDFTAQTIASKINFYENELDDTTERTERIGFELIPGTGVTHTTTGPEGQTIETSRSFTVLEPGVGPIDVEVTIVNEADLLSWGIIAVGDDVTQ